MTELDEHGRPEPPLAADEVDTLLGFLDYQRATLAWKCSGLDAAGLGSTVGPSSMTLGGFVQDSWSVMDKVTVSRAAQGLVTTYICENQTCQAPVVGARALEQALGK